MKTYKTWEVIKMISEDNKLEFKTVTIGTEEVILLRGKEGVVWENGGTQIILTPFILGCKWELVQQPVTFMEAINSGKKIKCEEYTSDEYIDIEQVIFELNRCTDIGILEAINGKWFIEGIV